MGLDGIGHDVSGGSVLWWPLGLGVTWLKDPGWRVVTRAVRLRTSSPDKLAATPEVQAPKLAATPKQLARENICIIATRVARLALTASGMRQIDFDWEFNRSIVPMLRK